MHDKRLGQATGVVFALGRVAEATAPNDRPGRPIPTVLLFGMDTDDRLDALPLGLLYALQEALADPTHDGQERARLRAQDAGLHILCVGGPDAEDPIALEGATDEVEGIVLRFG